MGAKKKKGMANRLAKMSDEDRAKYLQRKADIEEESKRRKEQLVTTFMKNKLKREDAFSRLNTAKINQEYHQVMRMRKCAAMKKKVKHLDNTVHRMVNLKDKTKDKIMDELNWQENLYLKNFKSHTEHMDKIIGFHNKQLSELRNRFDSAKQDFCETWRKKKYALEALSKDNCDHLNTIRYGQNAEALAVLNSKKDEYMMRADDLISTYKTELTDMRKHRERIISALWEQISKIMIAYVQRNDARRSHLAELQTFDIEGMAVISKNQTQINEREKELRQLHDQLSKFKEKQVNETRMLQNTIKEKTEKLLKIRKVLNKEIELDGKQLTFLTHVSQSAIDRLEKIVQKGEKLFQLIKICNKLEIGKDRNWEKYALENNLFEKSRFIQSSPPVFTDESQSESQSMSSASSLTKSDSIKIHRSITNRPKTGTSLSKRLLEKDLIFKDKTRKTLRKSLSKSLSFKLDSSSQSDNLLSFTEELSPNDYNLKSSSDNCFNVFDKMERLWWVYNQVKLDCIALKKQRNMLEQDNTKLKENVRDVLEAIALNQAIPSIKLSNPRVGSKRFILSAPVYSY